tara:strand:- start:1628 stop:2662 length:1035 start_codon:yes stop_codon:yes gene_type:complete
MKIDWIVERLNEHMILPAGCAGSDEWLLARKSGIGGSDVGGILGMNKYYPPLHVFNEKTSNVRSDDAPIVARAGTFLEPFVRELFSETGDCEIGKPVGMVPHKDYPFIFANVDDVGVSKYGVCVVEYKTIGQFSKKFWPEGEVPKSYWAQVQTYMQVLSSYFPGTTHFDHAVVVGLVANRELIVRLVSRDDTWWSEKALPRLISFWESVEGRNPDAFWDSIVDQIDGSEATTSSINKSFVPDEASEEVEQLDSVLDSLFFKCQSQKAILSEAKIDFESTRNQIKVHLKELQKGETGRYFVSWPLVDGRSSFDQSSFKEAHSELYSKFVKKSGAYRGQLTIKEKK